jgi:hypothetical protein
MTAFGFAHSLRLVAHKWHVARVASGKEAENKRC